jgi:hypothetical protein
VVDPTGSGKTVIFELALVRLLWAHALQDNDFKAVYIAPIKVSVPPWLQVEHCALNKRGNCLPH